MKTARRRKTRNQRRQDRRMVCAVLALVLFWTMILCTMVKAWAESPGEQPINGYEYLEYIGGDPYGMS